MTHKELEKRIQAVISVMRDYNPNEYASGRKLDRYAKEIDEALEEYRATHK